MTTAPDTILYTARASATGGRAGRATSDDGLLDVALAPPTAMGGPGGATNPEQLFAAGYAACFQSAMGVVGRREKVDTSASIVTAAVGIGPTGTGFGLSVELTVTLPGVDEPMVRKIVDAAHEVCPYSNATRGNIPVTISLG